MPPSMDWIRAQNGSYSIPGEPQYQGIANAIVQLIRWRTSGVIAASKYLKEGWQRHAGSDLETSRETRAADDAERLARQRLRVPEAAKKPPAPHRTSGNGGQRLR